MVNIGRVDFLVDFDGKKLPARAREIGRRVGMELGEGTQRAWDKQMSSMANDLENDLLESGKLAGINFSKSLEGAIRSRRSALSESLAEIFTDRDAFNDFVGQADNVSDGLDRVRAALDRARETQVISGQQWNELRLTAQNYGGSLLRVERATNEYKESLAGLNLDLDKMQVNQDRVNEAWEIHTRRLQADNDERQRQNNLMEDNDSLWSKLSFNVRQAIAITAAVASGGQQIVGLGSAVGGTLTALAGQVSYAAGAFIPLVAVLPNAAYGIGLMVSSLDELTDRAGPVKDAIDQIKGAFEVDSDAFADQWEDALGVFLATLATKIEEGGVGDAMGRAAAQVTDAFTEVLNSPAFARFLEQMGTTLPNALAGFGSGLATALQGAADVLAVAAPFAERIAAAFDTWATAWADDISEMAANGKLELFFNRAFEAADALWRIVDELKEGLGNVFDAGFQSGQRILGLLGDLAEDFTDWTDSIEGNKALNTWFNNSERIFEDLLELVGEVGAMFGRLVDQDSIDRLSEFLDNLSASMPFLEGILEVLGELDPFGILAQVLNQVGNALLPVLDLLKPLAAIFNTIATQQIPILATALGFLTPLFAPFEVALRLWQVALEKIQEYLAPFTESLQGLDDPLNGIADRIFEGVLPAFEQMLDKILGLLPAPEEMARIIEEDVIPAIQGFADWIVGVLVPALSDAYDWITDLVESLGGWDGISAKMAAFLSGLEFWARQFVNIFRGPVGWVENFLNLMSKVFGMKGGVNISASGSEGSIKVAGYGRYAAGGIADEASIFGEAGPELAVPLDRPLSQVDPSVRRLSAILQGKSSETLSSGNTFQRNIEAGAIQVIGSPAPEQTATAVLDRIVARVGG